MNINVSLTNQNIIQINGGITINVDVSVKNIIYVKKYVWNPSTSICECRKYLGSIMDDSVITCDEVMKLHAEKISMKQI